MNSIPLTRLPNPTLIWQETLDWQPSSEQVDRFQQLYESILTGNQQLNLTRITEAEDFWEKHLWDSLHGIKTVWNLSIARAIDIGTGAGFPGIPIAMTHPNWHVTLLDSTQKKIAFLNTIAAHLGLENVKAIASRAEQLARTKQHEATYDLALIRAVGSASLCVQYALPFLKPGGLAVLYRGRWTDEETADLTQTNQELGANIELIEAFTTPLTQGIRHCIYIRKFDQDSCPIEFPDSTD
jgi:16S rRNA (guanine527-N7)-methyltransferase